LISLSHFKSWRRSKCGFKMLVFRFKMLIFHGWCTPLSFFFMILRRLIKVPKDGKKDRHDIRERHFPSQTSWILVANSPRLRPKASFWKCRIRSDCSRAR
jgi:hypothetical protein